MVRQLLKACQYSRQAMLVHESIGHTEFQVFSSSFNLEKFSFVVSFGAESVTNTPNQNMKKRCKSLNDQDHNHLVPNISGVRIWAKPPRTSCVWRGHICGWLVHLVLSARRASGLQQLSQGWILPDSTEMCYRVYDYVLRRIRPICGWRRYDRQDDLFRYWLRGDFHVIQVSNCLPAIRYPTLYDINHNLVSRIDFLHPFQLNIKDN